MGIGLQFQFPSSVEADRMREFVGERFSHQAKTAAASGRIMPVAPAPTRISAAIHAPVVVPPTYPELERLQEYVEATFSWADTAGLRDSDRTELEELALSLRRELRGLRSEIEERQSRNRDRENLPKFAG
ncbi:hypothetical protein [Candidatus Korobacter versatilis]|nr:hypothetical protein [Candidatus Koribacter versatilis]